MTPSPPCNLSRPGRKRRFVMGIVAMTAAGAMFLTMDGTFESRWWRLALVPVVLFAFLCLIQVQENT